MLELLMSKLNINKKYINIHFFCRKRQMSRELCLSIAGMYVFSSEATHTHTHGSESWMSKVVLGVTEIACMIVLSLLI